MSSSDAPLDMPAADAQAPSVTARPRYRQYSAMILITVAVALMLGSLMRERVFLGPNTISRWCTVWALLEQGTYAIEDCPWQDRTQDKVLRPDPWYDPADPAAEAAPDTDTEGAETEDGDEEEDEFEARTVPDDLGIDPETGAPRRFYSSKPPLLPTIMAGILWPFREATGVPLDRVIEEERTPLLIVRETEDGFEVEQEEPGDPVEWEAAVVYFNLLLAAMNILPMLVMLVLFARLLDRYAPNDWAWILSLAAAAFGTNLFIFSTTLNNHSIAAYSAFFAIYAWIRIEVEGSRSWFHFALAGFFAAFTFCNELPAAAFAGLLFLAVLVRDFKRTLLAFVPGALIPLAGFAITVYLAFGALELPYAGFEQVDINMSEAEIQEVLESGSPYLYEGSYWLNPREADALREPKPVYAFHLLLGHHGFFSLTPVMLFALAGLLTQFFSRDRRLAPLALLTLLVSVIIFSFYIWKTHNYGGSTQGARWLFWLFPFWLVLLPAGLRGAEDRAWLRWLSLIALFVSAFTSGYGVQFSWSHPWMVDLLEHLGLYSLPR